MIPLARLVFASLLLVALSPAHAAPLSEGDRQVYRNGFAAARNGDWAAARREAAQAHDALLAKALHWLDLTRGGGTAPFSEIAEFIDSNPDWPGQLTLRQRAEEAAIDVGNPALSAWFQRFPPVSAAGKLRLAELLLGTGHQAEGEQRIREVWVGSDLTLFEEKSFLQRYNGILRPADHARRLDRLLWDGQFEAAHRMMPRVNGDERALATARIALAQQARNAERLVAQVPARLEHDQGLLFERMRWRRRRDHYDTALELLAAAPHDLAFPAAWANERQILARYALDNGDAALAYNLASRHGLTSGVAFAELEFFSGWVALRSLHKPDVAYNHFVHLYDEVKLPVSLARGAYWAARAAEAMSYHRLAEAWYGTASEHVSTFYGQLAIAQLSIEDPSTKLPDPNPTPAQIAAFESRELVQVARELGEVNAKDYVRPFVLRLSDLAKAPAEHALIAQLGMQLDRPDVAVAAAKKASYAGVTLLAEGYPLTELPPGGNVEPPLVLAMTRQESAFDQAAVSAAGAHGLMQLMPATAHRVAKSLRLPFSRSRLTTDTRYNVTLGRAYLDGLIGDFSGSYVLAVAAYNAGPARVRQWIRDHGDPRTPNIDVIDWIEAIPFSETRNYVQRVLENLQLYRLRLGDHGLAFSISSDLKR